jgi:hypothetical protein
MRSGLDWADAVKPMGTLGSQISKRIEGAGNGVSEEVLRQTHGLEI